MSRYDRPSHQVYMYFFGDDGVEAYIRSFEPNQVQLVGHGMMGV
jgi:hypothetical protein